MAQTTVSKTQSDKSVDPFFLNENLERLKASITQMETAGGTVHEANQDD